MSEYSNPRDAGSAMSQRSKKSSSGVEVSVLMEEVQNLIKPDLWHNIPTPVLDTIQGLISFTQTIAEKTLGSAEVAHKKVFFMDDRVTKIEKVLKSRFDIIESKLDRELKKLKEQATDT